MPACICLIICSTNVFNKQQMPQYHLQNRPNRELTHASEVVELLKRGKYAVIALCRDNEPYVVTLSYGYDVERHALFFHCAQKGLKVDFLRSNPRVCATVIEDGGYQTGECAHEYRSVVFWGTMRVVESLEEKQQGMSVLLHQLEHDAAVIQQMQEKADLMHVNMLILRLDIEQIHGKAGR